MARKRLLAWAGAAAIAPGAPGQALPCGDSLFPAQRFELPHKPRAMAAADFDRDGDADLAVLHSKADSFSLLSGSGDGSFEVAVEHQLPSQGRALAAADLDGDGDADLAITTYGMPPDGDGAAVLVLSGDGHGSFASAVAFPAGPFPSALAVGDLDGDGDPDIAATNELSGGTVAILLNDGSGTFSEPISQLTLGSPTSIAIGEFNGDGHRDLAVANASADALSILLGNGDGTFSPATLVPTGGYPMATVVDDLDGDGHDDVAVTAFSGNEVYIHLGDGNGGFANPMTSLAGSNPGVLAAGDLDGDHDADLVVINGDYGCVMFGYQFCVGVMRNLGAGTFEPFVAYPVGGRPAAVAIAELTGDGRADLAVGTEDFGWGVTVLRGRGDATFEAAEVLSGEVKSFRLAVADLNEDGNSDLVGTYVVRLGNGDGTFSPPIPHWPFVTSDLAVADLTGDGIMDLALAPDQLWHVVILQGVGDGSFVVQGNWVTAGECRDVIAADFDGDGDADLAVTAFHPLTPHLSLLFNDGAGNFAELVQYQVGGSPGRIAGGDLDGDGDADLAISDVWNETVWLTFNNGLGAFSPPVGLDLVYSDTTDIAIGDLDLDGRLDLVVSLGVNLSNQLAVFFNQGGVLFADPVYLDAGLGGGVTVGDINRDGLPDFVMGSIAVMLGAGGGTFGPPSAYGGFAGGSVGLLDIDHDGDLDVASNGARANVFVNDMCPAADLDGDGAVGIVDFLLLLISWGPCPSPCPPYGSGDVDGDCSVGLSDFAALLAGWG